MNLAKKYHKNPTEIANIIISKFDDRFENVNIAGLDLLIPVSKKKY